MGPNFAPGKLPAFVELSNDDRLLLPKRFFKPRSLGTPEEAPLNTEEDDDSGPEQDLFFRSPRLLVNAPDCAVALPYIWVSDCGC